jgi:predicted RNA-binding Zn-ribbon protein involved in translation (DUF1610 family)
MHVSSLLVLIALIIGWPVSSSLAAQAKPMSVAELALYKGKDRETILIEGAKKEAQVTFYTSNTWMAGYVSQEFGRKYPFIKTNVWRSDSKELLKRLTDEAAAGRFIADVVETSPDYMALLIPANMFQEVFSPELGPYDNNVKVKGKNGVFHWTSRELYISLGFNTSLISACGSAQNDEGSDRPEMERQNDHRRHDHGHPMDRRRNRSLRPRVSREDRQTRRQRAEHFRRRPCGAGRIRRSAACRRQSSIRISLSPNKKARRWSGGRSIP